MQIAIINSSTKLSNTDVQTMVSACSKQVSRDIAPAWNIKSVSVNFYKSLQLVPVGAYVIAILDDSDQADALGYHSEDNDIVYGRVFVNPVLNNGGVVLYNKQHPNNISVSSVLSHEVGELMCDQFVNSWCDGPEIKEGSEYAFEIADPVENDSYVIKVGLLLKPVSVSNFVFPKWFDSEAKSGQFDYLFKLNAPFTMSPGGYMIVRNGPGTEKAVFGEKYNNWKKNTKLSNLARSFKRGIKV